MTTRTRLLQIATTAAATLGAAAAFAHAVIDDKVKPAKTLQECVDGERIRWTEVPADGESAWTLKEPAPFIRLGAPVKQY